MSSPYVETEIKRRSLTIFAQLLFYVLKLFEFRVFTKTENLSCCTELFLYRRVLLDSYHLSLSSQSIIAQFASNSGKMSWNHRLLAFLVVLLNIAAAFATGEGSDLDCDPCIERPDYLVKVITHGTSNNEFWLKMRSSSLQAARDMRVAIEFQLYGKLMHLTCYVPC